MKVIKTMGVAAIAALALAVVPSIALAGGGVEASSYPVTFKGSPESPYSPVSFYMSGYGTSCSESSLEGSATSRTSTMAMNTWLKCGGVTLKANGCQFQFHPGSENTLDIGPSGCGPISGLIVRNGTCEVSIPSQTGIPATFTNEVSGGKEVIKATIGHSIAYNGVSGSGCTGHPELYLEAKLVLKGFDQVASQVNIHSSDKFSGFFIGTGSGQPKFEAESYPAELSGGLDAGSSFSFGFAGLEGGVTCSSAQLGSTLSAATTLLPVGGPSGCAVKGGTSVAIAMNSCSFTASVNNSGPPYTGGTGVGCATEGDAIVLSWPSCVIRIPAQSPKGSVSYENQGSGINRSVHAAASVSGLSYTYQEKICIVLGKEHTDGSLSASFTLNGP